MTNEVYDLAIKLYGLIRDCNLKECEDDSCKEESCILMKALINYIEYYK